MKKLRQLWCICSIAVFLAVVLILPAGVKAGLLQYSVTVTAGSDVAVFSGSGNTDADGDFEFVLVPLNSGQVIGNSDAAIENLMLRGNSDPEVGVEFGIRNYGSLAVTIDVLSTVVSFDPIVNPTAYASAGITLTDRSPAGAAITGLFPGDKVHQARYNGSSVFANLVSGFSITGGTMTGSEAKPLSDSEVIVGTLTSIESQFRFVLSAKDSASGTSTFVVIPEPATVGVLTIGAVLMLLKKQKR